MVVVQPIPRREQPVDLVQAELQKICGRFQLEPKDRSPVLMSHLSIQQLSGMDVAHVGLNAQNVTRCGTDIRRDPGDHFFLILQREGRAFLSQNGTSAMIDPGDMFLVDSTRESRFVYDGEYMLQLSVHLPREEMLHRFGRRIYGGHKVDKSDPLGLSMRALLAKLCTEQGGAQSHITEAFFSVFGALLTERAQDCGQTTNPDRFVVQRAMSVIADRYSDSDFTTTELAAMTGVSLRHLQRAFKLISETPHERLQAYRVRAARSRIEACADSSTKPAIASIAYQSGFSDLSTFYRLYRKAYGTTPGELVFNTD